MSSPAGPPTLDEARERLRRLGYLKSGVERFVFRRAIENVAGVVVPVVVALAVALALAQTAAVAASQFRYGDSPRAVVLLFLELTVVAMAPAAVLAFLVAAAAGRSRRPGRGAAASALAGAGAVLGVWLAATWRLGPSQAGTALLWGVPVAAAAVAAGGVIGASFLARAFARSGRLPDRPRRTVLVFAALAALSVAAILLATRRPLTPPAKLLPSPRPVPLLVVGIDGLALDSRRGPEETALQSLFSTGAAGWWTATAGPPAEIWTDIATGVGGERHGVRALEWVRPWGLPPLRPPFGSGWFFRGVGLAAGVVDRSPVSAWERRSAAFWEVAASAGLPSLAVGWWASGPWPGAEVVENREVLARATTGLGADAAAIAAFEKRLEGKKVAALYLPGADILRDDPASRRAALARSWLFLQKLIGRARSGEAVLAVISADSHPGPRSRGRIVVFEPGAPAGSRPIRPFDVAPSLLARAGIPVARDLPGRPAAALFAPGSLEAETVATYGDRAPPPPAPLRESDREYLEKLRSLGYLN